VLVVVLSQLGTAQLSPSAISVSPNLYELASDGYTVVYIGRKDRKKDLDTLPYIVDVRQNSLGLFLSRQIEIS
jgi:hypothetical protein